MSLPALTFSQKDFSAGQIDAEAARRDDIKLQRASLKAGANTRILATGGLSRRFGRAAYNLDTGRTEIARLSDTLEFEFLFGDRVLRIRDSDDAVVNEVGGLPWTLSTLDRIRLAQAERDFVIFHPGQRPYLLSYSLSSTPEAGDGEAIGDMIDTLAFPTVEATNSSAENSQTTSHDVALPADIALDDLLLIFFRTSGTPTTHNTPAGWTLLDNMGVYTSIFYRVANGGEGSTRTISTSDSRRSAHNSYRIRGFKGVPEADFAATETLDPPNLAPSWTERKTLWLAMASARGTGGTPSITAAPASYTDLLAINATSGGALNENKAAIGTARRNLQATSEDPGVFTATNNERTHAATVAIRGEGPDEAFDGETSKAAADCVRATDDTEAYIGLDFSADPQRISSATVYGSSNRGFISLTDGTEANPSVTLTLRGKNSSVPSSPSDGTSLGTATFTDTGDESAGRTIASTDTTTTYDYVWVQIAHDAAASRYIYCAQLEIVVYSDTAAEQWSFRAFRFGETAEGAKRQPYFRYAPKGIVMTPSARTGSGIDLTFSSPVLDAAHVGVSFRYHDREMIITEVTDASTAKANVVETLPPTRRVDCTNANARDSFKVGQVAIGGTTGAEGLIVDTNGAQSLDIVVYKGDNFAAAESLTSETGHATITGTPTEQTIVGSQVWDEAAMSDFRGWPRWGVYDRSRLIMCDFPQASRAIAFSAVGAITDLAVGADPASGFLEFAPGNGRVLSVIGGADQYVLTDQGAMYIPISETNPLQPGSVAFRPIAAVGAADVAPVSMHEGIVYVAANGNSLVAIVPTGQTAMPYRVAAISEFHSDLFTGIKTMAAMTGGGTSTEQYLWLLQDDGTALAGKFDSSNEWAGFLPVTGEGTIQWLTALGADVRFNVQYQDSLDLPWAMEQLDETQYLDCGVPLNAAVPSLRPDPDTAEGRLWFLAGLTVNLMDGDTWLGARAVDSNGDIVEEAGDDFSASTVMAGFGFDVEVKPWVPDRPEGEERGQRLRLRRVKRAAVTVQGTTEFTFMGQTFGGAAAAGGTYRAPGQIRAFEPEIVFAKTMPGPMTIIEIAGEVTT